MLASAELRVRMLDARLLERVISFGLAGFLDTGRVWQLQGNDGDFFDLHSGSGGGLRNLHGEFLLRFDVGTSSERAVNVYITFGNCFLTPSYTHHPATLPVATPSEQDRRIMELDRDDTRRSRAFRDRRHGRPAAAPAIHDSSRFEWTLSIPCRPRGRSPTTSSCSWKFRRARWAARIRGNSFRPSAASTARRVSRRPMT